MASSIIDNRTQRLALNVTKRAIKVVNAHKQVTNLSQEAVLGVRKKVTREKIVRSILK